MKKCTSALLLGLTICIGLCSGVSAIDPQAVFHADFTADPGWITSDAGRFYRDYSDSTYNVNPINIDGGGNYAYQVVDYNGLSFRLEADIQITQVDFGGILSLGLYDLSLMSQGSGNYATLSFIMSDSGVNTTTLEWRSGTANGSAVDVSNLWSAGVWYTVVVQYNHQSLELKADVLDRATESPVLSLTTVCTAQLSYLMDALGHSNQRPGTYAVPGAQSWGKFDNVSLDVWCGRYWESFSGDPGWTTNDPGLFYWDDSDSTYYLTCVNVSDGGYYAYFETGYNWGFFKLQADVQLVASSNNGSLSLGLYDSSLVSNGNAPFITMSFIDAGDSNMIMLESNTVIFPYDVVDVDSNADWSYDTWYQVTIFYDRYCHFVHARVHERDTGHFLGVLTLSGLDEYLVRGINRVGYSNLRVGAHPFPGAHIWGKIDNFSFAVDCPCEGRTGNVDMLGRFPADVDSADLGVLIVFLFSPTGTFMLPSWGEADVSNPGMPNCGAVDSSDLGMMVFYLFSPPGTVTLPDCYGWYRPLSP